MLNLDVETYNTLIIRANEGYYITNVRGNYDNKFPENGLSYSNYLYGDEKEFTVTTVKQTEFRDASIEVYVDDPTKVNFSFGSTYYRPELTAGWQTINYSSAIENTVTIGSMNWDSELYQVKKDDVVLEPDQFSTSYQVSLTGVTKLEIYADFPEEAVPVHFVFEPEDASDFVTKLTVNNEEVAPETYLADGYTVMLGAKMNFQLNNNDFKIIGVYINDVQKEYVYTSLDNMVKAETTYRFVVERYAQTTKTIIVEGVEELRMCAGSYFNEYNSPISLKAGSNEYTYSTKNNQIAFEIPDGYEVKEILDNGIDKTGDITRYSTSIYLENEGELKITVGEKVYDQTLIVYIDDKSPAEYLWLFDAYRSEKTLENGYNTVKYCTGEAPFQLSCSAAEFNNVYLNNEKVEGYYGTHQLNVVNNDVVKVYLTSNPELQTVNFTNEAETPVECTVDLVTPHDLSDIQVFPGTCFKVSGTDGAKIAVKVGETELGDAESHEFTVTEPTTVLIKDAQGTGIENVNAAGDTAEKAIYNLQGVRLGTDADLDRLPSGMYIVGGRKVMK